jgi:hypothetical protein
MKQLLALFALLLTVGTAHAQADKKPNVTKLPGEEKLSTRERAERDFLMPVRRRQLVADAPKASIEDNTAAPESDVTAHAGEATDEVRTVEEVAAPVRVARTTHSTRTHSARRSTRSKAVHHSSRSKASSKKASHSSTKKSSTHKKSTAKKTSSKKSSSKKASAKKTSSAKKKTSSHKRRR